MPACTARVAPAPRYEYPKLTFSECCEARGLQDDFFCQDPALQFPKQIILHLIWLGMPVVCRAEVCAALLGVDFDALGCQVHVYFLQLVIGCLLSFLGDCNFGKATTGVVIQSDRSLLQSKQHEDLLNRNLSIVRNCTFKAK